LATAVGVACVLEETLKLGLPRPGQIIEDVGFGTKNGLEVVMPAVCLSGDTEEHKEQNANEVGISVRGLHGAR
jgi:hypothetical protein